MGGIGVETAPRLYLILWGSQWANNDPSGGSGHGPRAGVTIVGGHEFAETETDQFPDGGWLDSGGAENGDKCARLSSGQGAAQHVALRTGTFAVQSLWSNAFHGGAGGCVVT